MGGNAEAEVARLMALDLPADRPAMKALGVKEIIAYINGDMERAAAIEAAQQATRRYAKRQMTWFRNQMTDWAIYSEKEYIEKQDIIFSLISKNSLTTK